MESPKRLPVVCSSFEIQYSVRISTAGVLLPAALVAGLASFAGLLHVSLVGKCVASGSLLASVVPFSHLPCMYLFEFMLLRFRFGGLEVSLRGLLVCVG